MDPTDDRMFRYVSKTSDIAVCFCFDTAHVGIERVA